MSFFYLGKEERWRYALTEFGKREPKVRCFLDSGAYSAQMQSIRKGKPLDKKTADGIVNKYIDFIYTTDFLFDFLVTFDYLRDPEIVLWSAKKIEARGLHPVPVYHQGSSITALRDLIDRGYTLIGISLADPRIFTRTKPFLDHVFNLTEKYGIRCHGLGAGGREILSYPWFSVDSTTWLQDSRLGNIGQMSLNDRHLYQKVPISSRKSAVGNSMVGDTYAERVVHNIRFWNDLMDRLDKRPVPKHAKALF
jgi:hypothetical protein